MPKMILVLLLSFFNTLTFAKYSAPQENNVLYYHLTFPVTITEQTEKLSLNDNYADLIISNLVAGSILSHLIHEQFPHLQFDEEYMVGSLFGQLLQENLNTRDYQSASNWINPNKDIRAMLLAPGQGGPYQINDYSKRLEHGLGLINFSLLQKSLGYTIEDQDSGAQTAKNGPLLLDDKYFGPVAAAFFQYNDLLRLQSINKDPWGPSAPYFSACITNLGNTPHNFLDMIQNAAYNAGPWADINKTYIQLCANYPNPDYQTKIKHINDYTLDDVAYQQAVGTKEAAGSTFILYPRQIRFYLDELYNNPTSLQMHNTMNLPVQQLKTVFAKVMKTLAYQTAQRKYDFIDEKDANVAFDMALSSLAISVSATLNLGHKIDKDKIISLLETAVDHLEKKLGIHFNETTNQNY